MEGNAEEGSSLFPCNAAAVNDGTAPRALLLGHIHDIFRKTTVDDGNNHFMVLSLHIHSPLPSRLLLKY